MVQIPKRVTKEIYADLPKDLKQNPVSLDISRKTNVEAVKESLKNLVMTERGERLFQPHIGCDIRSLLFDNATPDVLITAKQMIKDVIRDYEPRCMLNDVDVLFNTDGDVFITILFYVINIDVPIEYTITLKRVR